MKKKLLIIFACLLFVSGCKDVKLKNGENAIVTFKEGAISSDDLYNLLKERYSSEVITDLIDSYLLNKKYESSSEEKSYVNQGVKTIEASAEEASTTLETYIKLYYGLKTKDDLKDYLSLNYKRNLWVIDYSKKIVSEKQINQYYENYVYGDVDASAILITVDSNNNASDDDKTASEEKALKTAKEVITKLNNGSDFAKLAKEYSKDQTSANNGGALGKVNKGDLDDVALDALRELKDGSYTKSPVKTSSGYYILYRKSMDEKKELTEELKNEIIEIIAKELQEEDGFAAKALLALREENEMKFVDTTLEKEYKNQ